jgi:hypothetical protein
MPKQYFDQKKKFFDHNKKYFVDNEESPKKEEVPTPVIQREFTRRQDFKPITKPKSAFHTHVSVDDKGDTVKGGVCTRDIEDFSNWAKTKVKEYQLQTVPPKGVVGIEGNTFDPSDMSHIKENLKKMHNIQKKRNTRKPPPPLKSSKYKDDLLDIMDTFFR